MEQLYLYEAVYELFLSPAMGIELMVSIAISPMPYSLSHMV